MRDHQISGQKKCAKQNSDSVWSNTGTAKRVCAQTARNPSPESLPNKPKYRSPKELINKAAKKGQT